MRQRRERHRIGLSPYIHLGLLPRHLRPAAAGVWFSFLHRQHKLSTTPIPPINWSVVPTVRCRRSGAMRCPAVGALHMGQHLALSSGATLLPAFADFPVRTAAGHRQTGPTRAGGSYVFIHALRGNPRSAIGTPAHTIPVRVQKAFRKWRKLK